MELTAILERCEALERRVGALYRTFAAATRDRPNLCALWTSLARDEEAHGSSLATARQHLDPDASQTRLEGWNEALREAEEQLAAAERVGGATDTDRQLAVALELEMTELEPLRRLLLAVTHREAILAAFPDHGVALAEAAERHSNDPGVRLQAALLRARTRLGD